MQILRLSTFGLIGMAIGPVYMSLLYEHSGGSFRLPLTLLAIANASGAVAMAVRRVRMVSTSFQ